MINVNGRAIGKVSVNGGGCVDVKVNGVVVFNCLVTITLTQYSGAFNLLLVSLISKFE